MAMRALFGTRLASKSSSQSLNSLDEAQTLEDALRAVTLIMNDDVDGAEAELAKGTSPFHKQGKGVVAFLRATMSFELETMREAAEKLAEAETAAYEYQRKAQRHPSSSQCQLYSPGSEYALSLALSQLMGAMLCMLNESLTEGIRGFYKLRKAYLTLSAILDEEKLILTERGRSTTSSAEVKPENPMSAVPSVELTDSDRASPVIPASDMDGVARNDEFFDANEQRSDNLLPEYTGHLDLNSRTTLDDRSTQQNVTRISSSTFTNRSVAETAALSLDPNADIFASPFDQFVHSGVNMCFGVVLLMLSLIPPAFASLLKIIGFKGDREKGIELLWAATHYPNLNGAIAGLMLLGYYHGILGFADIVPLSGSGSYPRDKCKALLEYMRARFPKSHLWLLENARLLGAEKKVEDAIDLLRNIEGSAFKQVDALQWFERSLDAMYIHDYAECARGFEKCIALNNWSHGLYYYISGSAHVELYRDHKTSDAKKAARHAAKAKELLALALPCTGRKRFMARQLPLDAFVHRKIQKWTHRAESWGVDLVDAVGVAPIEEMIYLWNGYKRMQNKHLEYSLLRLDWSTSEANALWAKEDLDEHAILALLRASTLRAMGETGEARKVLAGEILKREWREFNGHLKDNWTAPCARYEMAVIEWTEFRSVDIRSGSLQECSNWLEKVARWESFELDARFGLRVATARDTLKRYGVGPGA